jgi:MscS family membrane protein
MENMDINSLLLSIQELMASNVYISATIILIIFFITSRLIIIVAEKIFLKYALKTKTTIDEEIIKITSKPISIFILLVGFRMFFTGIWSRELWGGYIDKLIASLMIIIAVFTAVKIIDLLIDHWSKGWAKKTKNHIDSQLVLLIHRTITVACYVTAALWVLAAWGIEVGPLLAGLGIGGLALALALQPTLSNIFGGVSLILDKAIKVGDTIKLQSGEGGTVYDIGLRSTKIKTWNNQIIIISNSKLVDSMVTNFNQPDRTIRIDIEFGVAYGSKIDKVKKIALDCLKGEKNIIKTPEPKVWFTEMDDSSLNFKLMFYADDLNNKWTTHQNVITKLYESLNKNRVTIPFPQREIWVHDLGKKK